jgi:hypothetical protein
MRKASFIAALSVGSFFAGLLVAWCAITLSRSFWTDVENQAKWNICREFHMTLLGEALKVYAKSNAHQGPVTLATLVDAKLLPEWSEVYICPGQLGCVWHNTNFNDSTVTGQKLSEQLVIAANYTNCVYYIETLPDCFVVRCRYHTKERVIIPRGP